MKTKLNPNKVEKIIKELKLKQLDFIYNNENRKCSKTNICEFREVLLS